MDAQLLQLIETMSETDNCHTDSIKSLSEGLDKLTTALAAALQRIQSLEQSVSELQSKNPNMFS